MADIKATPQNPLYGALSSGLQALHEGVSTPFGYNNPPARMLSEMMGIPSLQQTVERLSYGEPLTTGKGMTTKPRPEAVEAALALAGIAPSASKVAPKILDEVLTSNARRAAWDPTGQRGVIGVRFKTGTPTEVPGFGSAKEIPDTYSYLKPSVLQDMMGFGGNKNITLKDLLDHPSLYRDYPELAKTPVQALGMFDTLKGAYHDGKIRLRQMPNATPSQLKEVHSTLLHEIQHGIQDIDKMPVGGMSNEFFPTGFTKGKTKIDKLSDANRDELLSKLKEKGMENRYGDIIFNNKSSKQLLLDNPDLKDVAEQYQRLQQSRNKLNDVENAAYNSYKNLAGEAQARAIQKRFLTPGEYRKPVLESYDVPQENLIFKEHPEKTNQLMDWANKYFQK